MFKLLHLCGYNAGDVWVSTLQLPLRVEAGNLITSRLDSPRSSPLKRHLLLDPEDDYGICHDFLAESVKRMEEDDSIATGIVGAVEEMSRDLSKMNMRDDYKPYMRVC